jgi:hypothetical protein
MNRRNVIKGTIAAVLVPEIGTAKSRDDMKREALRGLLQLSNDDAHEMT